jgi:glycosyltransferase involved in cell wall biosynthesis
MNHVALVIPGIDRLAGAELQVLHVALGLHERKWNVTVIALSGTGGEAGRELVAAGVNFLTLGMRNGLADPPGWIKLHQWIKRHRPDVIHAHLPHAAWIVRWSRLFAPVRVALDTVHTSSCGTLGRRLGYRYSNWLVDAVTAVSGGAATAYCSARMVSADRVVVIPNGVDTCCWNSVPSERQSIRKQLGLDEEFVWLAAGRLEPVKNYGALLDAFALIPRNARLVIAGTGPLEAALRDRCTELGVGSRVTFLGYERDLLHWMQAADAFVLNSLWEGLPTVLLEAGACCLPAVATSVSGSQEVLVDGETGLLTEPGSTALLAEAMWMMMRMDPSAREDLGRKARLRVMARFSLEAVLHQWETFYSKLLNERPHVSRFGHPPSPGH